MADGVNPKPRKPRTRKPAEPAPQAAVDIFEPAYEAHKLRLTGLGWREVASVTGYATEDAARIAVAAYLTKAASMLAKEQQLERLAAELDRLDVLTQAYWIKAVSGDDLYAARFVLDVSRHRAKLLRLDTDEKDVTTTRTIVVAGSEADYVAGLQRAALQGNRPVQAD